MKPLLAILFMVGLSVQTFCQKNRINVIAYYSGHYSGIDGYPVEKLTHIIYSFVHLKGNRLSVDSRGDSNTIRKLVSLKNRNPKLKVLLALGGWGGCKNCSPVFSTAAGREEFALSAKQALDYFKADGIDIDWEYPAVKGYEGHPYSPEDKNNFTELIKAVRRVLGTSKELSFAAGALREYLENSFEWNELAPYIDRVNLMTYDLVNSRNSYTGHHTPLYSTRFQKESTDNAVRYLDSLGFPGNKMVIGAAFYGRLFEGVDSVDNGLNRAGKFKNFITYLKLLPQFNTSNGYKTFWDDEAKAPYAYSSSKKIFATFDNERSVELKTSYAIEKGLNGIMFWELSQDRKKGGFVDAIWGKIPR